MPIAFHEAGPDLVVIDGDACLSIENASDFREFLRDRARPGITVHLEFAGDAAVDLTGLQLLCSACRSASDLGGQLVLQGALPASLAQLVEAAGITRHTVCKNNGGRACSWFGGTP